jgi:phthalate 3,4-dioxygenase ferredoxin reductase subunit
VIIGASVAGVRTAQALRSEGYDGQVVLVGEEPELPYDKPPLSKALLAGTTEPEALRLLTQTSADAAGIEMLMGHRALRVDLAAKVVELDGHDPLGFDQLVIATGASARPAPWGEAPGIHVLRTMQDSRALRQDMLRGGHVVVVGAGFIGAEVASTARLLGLDVTIVDPLAVPMSRLLNTEIGEWFTDLHRRHGVTTAFGTGVEGIEGERGRLRVRLTDGRVLEAETAVVGIGAQPNDEWLKPSGLVIDNGVVCDEHCRAVDVPYVFAVGDVARWFHPGRGEETRIEHWTNAVDQAVCVAHNIARPDDLRSYAPVEYVWSDQYDWKVQVAGRVGGVDRHILVGDPQQDNRFAALYTEDGSGLTGAAIVNWPRALVACRRALQNGAHVRDVRATIETLANAPSRKGLEPT